MQIRKIAAGVLLATVLTTGAASASGNAATDDPRLDYPGWVSAAGGAPAFDWPLRGRITTRYGVPGQIWRLGYHPGLDLARPTGTPIQTAGEGLVLEAGWDELRGYGNYVKIDHGDGLVTLYAHMSEVIATVGERVEAGQLVGLVGSTGVSTGPHLHFEVRQDDQTKDPLTYLPG